MLNVVYWVRGEDYAKMVVHSAESMKRVYKGAKVIVYADQSWPVFESDVIDEVICLPIQNKMPAMIANVHGQVHYVINNGFDRLTLFCDADVLAHTPAPLESLAEYDLIVTKRDHVKLDKDGKKLVGVAQRMPYNYGVLFANPTMEAKEVFIWIRERVIKMGSHLQDWYGNQWALRELVGGSMDEKAPREVKRAMAWGPVSIKVEDCSMWNYLPHGDEPLDSKYFLHVKGEDKDNFYKIAEELVA
jgi:hypothetical protein